MQTLLLIVFIFILLFVAAVAFMKYYPVFGGQISTGKESNFRKSKNYRNGKFVNQIPTSMDMSFKENVSTLVDFIKGNPNAKPKKPISIERFVKGNGSKGTRITWFGHSAFLIEIDGKTLLLDPMFGTTPSPFPMIGGKRYSRKLPFEINELPEIDAVILSHNHYDHLDYGTIKKIKNKVKRFITPLGVGSNLEKWGVDSKDIEEHDWWDHFHYEGLDFVSAPARHFSGRSLLDRDATLWSSWIIKGVEANVFFSGDSGYAPHFKEIGEKYGPFDVTLIECGQYDKRWATIHMVPEETVQAHIDVKGNLMIPIHWAAFTLALHDWTDPIERAVKAASERNVSILTPRIGESIVLGSSEYPATEWWKG